MPAIDDFTDDPNLLSSATHAYDAGVGNDGNDLPHVSRFIRVGATGDVTLVTKGGETVTFKAVQVGELLRVRASRVKATGTTATGIIALW